MCFFFDYNSRARHPLLINRKNHNRVANLLYWKNHYALIANISRLFSDITNQSNQNHFWLLCFGHSSSEEVFARHIELCTRDDFMSVLHLLH